MGNNIVKSFSFKEEQTYIFNKIEELAKREGKKTSQVVVIALEEYAKKHAEGNPNYTLDKFEDPNFKACPAFFRDKEIWVEYLNKLDEKQYRDFDSQLNLLLNLGNRRYKQF